MTEEEFEELQYEKRFEHLRRMQEEKIWGGNHVPRAQIMPSYRMLSAEPARPCRTLEVESAVHLNAEATSPYENVGVVIDMRLRHRGKPERILPSN
jgi:hypothetical protein